MQYDQKRVTKRWKKLPMCGFIAQLVEHRTGIAEVMGSDPVEALTFFRLLLSNCLNWKIYCDDHTSLSSTTAVQIWIISYIFQMFPTVRLSIFTLESCCFVPINMNSVLSSLSLSLSVSIHVRMSSIQRSMATTASAWLVAKSALNDK